MALCCGIVLCHLLCDLAAKARRRRRSAEFHAQQHIAATLTRRGQPSVSKPSVQVASTSSSECSFSGPSCNLCARMRRMRTARARSTLCHVCAGRLESGLAGLGSRPKVRSMRCICKGEAACMSCLQLFSRHAAALLSLRPRRHIAMDVCGRVLTC